MEERRDCFPTPSPVAQCPHQAAPAFSTVDAASHSDEEGILYHIGGLQKHHVA